MTVNRDDIERLMAHFIGHGVNLGDGYTHTFTPGPTLYPRWYGRILLRLSDWLHEAAFWHAREVESAPYTFEIDEDVTHADEGRETE